MRHRSRIYKNHPNHIPIPVGLENAIQVSDGRHPADFIEPPEPVTDGDDEANAVIRETLLWCAAGKDLPQMGTRAVEALVAIRPDLAVNATHTFSMESLSRFTELLAPVNENESGRVARAIKGCVVILSWITRGVLNEDKSARLLVVLRYLKFGEFADMTFEQIARRKGCSRQHIGELHRKFVETYGVGADE